MPRIKLELPALLPFVTEIEIRISDTNYRAHLGNDALLSILHECRIRYLASMGFTESDIDGAGIIMADSAIEYRSEAFQGEILQVAVGAHEFSRCGCDLAYTVREKTSGREVARAKTGIVFYDYASRRAVPVPDNFRNACRVDNPEAA